MTLEKGNEHERMFLMYKNVQDNKPQLIIRQCLAVSIVQSMILVHDPTMSNLKVWCVGPHYSRSFRMYKFTCYNERNGNS